MSLEHSEHAHEHHDEKLHLIASPLNHRKPEPHHHHKSDVEKIEHNHGSVASSQVPFANRDYELHNTPEFHRHAEAQSIELFYDLFFVANLTNFTSNHAINTTGSK